MQCPRLCTDRVARQKGGWQNKF